MHCYFKVFILLIWFLFLSSQLNAEIKSYTHTVKQTFGGAQSPDDAFGIKIIARVDVDTSVLEESVKKFYFDKLLLDKYEGSQKYIQVLLAKINILENENKRIKSFPTQVQKKSEEELREKFSNTSKELTAVDWIQKGEALWNGSGYTNPQKASDYFNNAIELDPNYALA